MRIRSFPPASGEFGIDGIAIIVNDAIVDDEEQLDDIIAHSPVLQVQPTA